MLLVGNNKYTRYENGGIVPPAVITDESDYEEQGTTGQDSGNEDDEDLDASEEIFLPQEEDDDPDFESRPSPDIDDEEILYRQMAYPPLPEYNPPIVDYQSDESGKAHNSSKYVSKKKDTRFHARERLGVLTPMEEVTEPPSSAGTEASGVHRSRNRHKNTRSRLVRKNKTGQTKDDPSNHPSDDQQKSILKSKSPLGSPDRRVKFVGAGSVTQSETESQSSEYSKNNSDHSTRANESSTIQEEDDDESHESGDPDVEDEAESISADGPINASPTMEQVEKVETWQLGSDNDNQEPPMSNIDAEFASILDDIIAELHSWDRLAGTGASISEVNASRQDHLANISSHLTSYLGQVSPSTVMSNLPQLIPLITSLLSLTEPSFRAQLSSLNAVNVFSDKLKDCKIQTGLKILPQADLTWLVRSLCDVSSESSKSVLKSVGTAALASLVKAAGPEMICEPILLILLGEDEKVPKRPEGSGNIVTTTGIPGGPPKTKATALDALTFALLTFPRDAFDLEVVARLACHCLLHNKRRVRQAALECLAVVAHSLTSGVALPLFRKFISEEELALISEVNNNSLNSEETPSPSKLVDFASHYDSELEIDPRIFGPPSKIPVPIKVSEAHQKLQTESSPKKIQAPTSPAKPVRRPNPTSAVSARISRHVLPSPNVEELVEYGVKIPANCQLLSRQSLKVGGQEESCDDDVRDASSSGGGGAVRHTLRERLSSGGESCSSVSNIEYTLLELDPILSTHGSSGGRRNGRGNNNDGSQEFIIAPDVEWILNGTGAVKKCDPTTMLPKELSILAPGTTKYQQWNNNLGSKSGNESDFSSSVASSQTRTLGGGNNSDNNMKRINSTRNDLLQDSFVQGHLVSDTLLVGSSDLDEIPNYTSDQSNNHGDKLPPIMSWNQEFKYIHPDIANSQEPVLGRYYYPPTSHIVSPRAVLNTSDPLSSRFSSKSSYNLLPSKYTVMRNTNQYRGGGHDLVSPHVLLPGAYDNPYVSNAYSDSSVGTTGSWHSDLGSLSKINLKPKPLEPIQSLREKFFESARRNETLRSDSQQSGATEEESEPEHEKTESQHIKPAAKPAPPKQRNQNVNQESRKPPIAPRPMVPPTNLHADNISKGNKRDGVTSQDDEVSVRRQTETLIHGGVSREYHVYNSRVEIDPAAAARSPIAPLGSSLPPMVKRGDADSAGSNHTRDSGVSVGSVGGGSKTPPSVHNTPPTHHKNPSLSQRNSSAAQREQAAVHDARTQQLNRNWQSTPDVPLETNAERNLETLQAKSVRQFQSHQNPDPKTSPSVRE
ncbi:hypothetical protein Fcan01_13191 [Folsomia candida]|uniref:Uncharacterized protein n=1 Tax=Folsomia candida TaxID=158441 RepID=A0A226E3F7_FOLCA|nr:hypothetical protein Fcan01_13191 [Folsomia candida]